jgi:creatinine amidohydrolase
MQLILSTWPEVEAYLRTRRVIIVPIGSTEQHGPTGLLGTDAITAELIAARVGEAQGVLVAPTLSVGMAQHHLAFAGTMSLRPSTLIAVISDVVGSLARHGFEQFYFINGHGGNSETASAAFSEIHASASFSRGAGPARVRCRIANWWEADGVQAFCAERYGEADGAHATASEIAVTQFRYPDHIKRAGLSPKIASPFVGGIHDAEDYRRRFPDGRIGSDPSLSNPQDGERLVEIAVAGLSADLSAFISQCEAARQAG